MYKLLLVGFRLGRVGWAF